MQARNWILKQRSIGQETGKQEEPKALVTIDGDDVDWTGHAEDEQENFALIAYSNSGSNTKMSTRDKSGLGYGDQVHNGVLSYENEVFQSVFDSRSSDVEDSPVHDRFANVEGMHAVPPPMTGNYMPSGPDREVDDSMFTYGPKQSKTSESDTQTSNYDSCESNSSAETLESVPEPVVVEPKVVSQPKVWSDAPIIEEYESDSDDEYVIQPSKEQEKPSFAFVNTVKHVKTPRETVKEQNTYSPSPKANKRDWNGLMSKRHQELASPEQTVSGKDFSNPLIVDSLLKTIWFTNAPCFFNEALAIPGQTATGKELSNLLMAGSLPKTTLPPKLLE
ncbi:hypothetical protein Tco_1505822 [Tanacetum coccineum]